MRELHITDGRLYVRLPAGELRIDVAVTAALRPPAGQVERRYLPDEGKHFVSDGANQTAALEGAPWLAGDQFIADVEAVIAARIA